MSDTYTRIYRVIRRIPRGKVATYGQIARLAGFPGQARLAGYALHALRDSEGPDVPWWRVINARGESSLGEFSGADLQKELLKKESVIFDRRGRVDMKRFAWKK
jgi:methylated-DNA-protein-cysteine methyltransferase-like protein